MKQKVLEKHTILSADVQRVAFNFLTLMWATVDILKWHYRSRVSGDNGRGLSSNSIIYICRSRFESTY